MKKIMTKKGNLTLLVAMLMVVSFATAGYSDSFVDDNTINALKDFKFGQSNSFGPVPEKAVSDSENEVAFTGDSFVNANVINALKDFRFGEYTPVEAVTEPAPAKTWVSKGDSFVNASVIEQMEGFVFLKGVVKTDGNHVADQGFIYGKN